MYADRRLPGSLQGIESLNFAKYWQAVKDKIQDLRQLPIWATNHAQKLGIAVTNLRARGDMKSVEILQTEIDKVNDDIVKGWKVRQYIDKYLPEWLSVANGTTGNSAPIVPSASQPSAGTVPVTSTPTPMAAPLPFQTPATPEPSITGWISSWFGGGGVNGLGVVPVIAVVASASAIAALAYVVTTGMALYQDYVTKKDLTTAVIEGKMTSGQAADIMVASRPPENAIANMFSGIGTNVGTMLALGAIAYFGLTYLATSKSLSRG